MMGMLASARRFATPLVIAFVLVTALMLAIPGSAQGAGYSTIVVTLDANGGHVGPTEVTTRVVERGDTLGSALPTPSRSRYEFKGWYNAQHGGSQITSATVFSTSNSTYKLYARWAPTRFLQGDSRWAGQSYAGSTIGARGCGVATTTQAVYTLTDKNITPATAASWSKSKGYDTASAAEGRTLDAFFREWPATYGIAVTQLNTGDIRSQASKADVQKRARDEVAAGDWVICLMEKGNWTTVGHFVLWYDIDGDLALIRDPLRESAGYDGVLRRCAPITLLQSQAKRYWVIDVPEAEQVSRPTATPGVTTAEFRDVNTAMPYVPAILELANAGIVSGFGDDTFRPDSMVIRQQFTKMILGTLGLEHDDAQCTFEDVSPSQVDEIGYPYHFIAKCVNEGIVKGYADGTFGPAKNMTRAQLITMVVRAAETRGLLTQPMGDVPWSNFDPAHFDNTRKAYANGLLSGLRGLAAGLNFNAPATRGEVAQILANYLSKSQ